MTTVLLKKSALHGPSKVDPDESGRRVALRKWFHTLRKDKFEDNFQEDECISLEEAESLILVPSLNLNSGFTCPEASPEREIITNRHNQKMRDFKTHLRSKFRHFKLRHNKVDNKSYRKLASKTKDNIQEEETAVRALFGDICQEDEGGLTKDKGAYASGPNVSHTSELCTKAHDGGNALFLSDSRAFYANSSGSRVKRASNYDFPANSSFKRSCSSKELSPASSVESMRNEDATNRDEQSSIQITPPCCLSKSPVLEGSCITKAGLSSATDTQGYFADPEDVESSNIESSHTGYISEDNSLLDDLSTTVDDVVSEAVSCAASIPYEKVYTIPTFRRRNESLRVANIAKCFKDGTLNEEELIQFVDNATNGNESLTFKNREFYDDPSNESNDQPANVEADDRNYVSGEERVNVKTTHQVCDVKERGAVKFDRLSCLIVYKPSTKSTSFVNSETKTLRDNNRLAMSDRKVSVLTEAVNQGSNNGKAKSILKIKSNTREREELRRALSCDDVDVESFMELFNHFESKKQMEEEKLGEVREDQLNNYYSRMFFPEILEDVTQTTARNSEFTRSRKATEINIGRNLGALKCNLVHYVCPTCDTKIG